MNELIVTAALAPIMRDPNPRAELVSQMVLGETADVQEQRGEWIRLLRHQDRYTGWVHRGYGRVTTEEEGGQWRERAGYRAEAARLVDDEGREFAVPLLARLAAAEGGWELPTGRRARLLSGSVRPVADVVSSAHQTRLLDWAVAHFSGAPYLWGGITPWGADCSGMVQTAYIARGIALPRDSADQATCGAKVTTDRAQPGDLLFFSETGERISHVAFLGDGDTLIHSTLACGGFLVEPWSAGSRAGKLRETLVAVRRVKDR